MVRAWSAALARTRSSCVNGTTVRSLREAAHASCAATLLGSKSAQEQFRRSLAFVNRSAEALDVLYPNLANQEALRTGDITVFATPLAAQPPGTGKTSLGVNMINILRRPREGAAEEAVIAARLSHAWCLDGRDAAIQRGRRDSRDENLVMRVLLCEYEHHAQLLQQLKHTTPVVIQMKLLVEPAVGLDFDTALGYAIYTSAHKLNSRAAASLQRFKALSSLQQSAMGVVNDLVATAPVLLVLDDITDLSSSHYASFFATEQRSTPLHRAMTTLSLTLQKLHTIPGCLVFCTGRSLWLSTKALIGASSPLLVTPTLLHALTPADVVQALKLTTGVTGNSLLHDMGVDDAHVEQFADAAVRLTGGVGRALQFLLRARQAEYCSGNAPRLTSNEQAYTTLNALERHIADVPGMLLRVTWGGPRSAAVDSDLPSCLQREEEQVKLLRLFTRMLLLETAFPPDATLFLGGESVRITDAAVVLGLTYTVAPPHQGSQMLRLVASDWLCRSLLHEPRFNASTLISAQLLAVMRMFAGTMRGRPFELLCADALCHKALLASTARTRWDGMLPHMAPAYFASECVGRLQVVALPKVVDDVPLLTSDAKAHLLRSRAQWTHTKKTIHSDDVPWLLEAWLPVGSLGVPADAASGSQDLVLRLPHGVCGIALKAVGQEKATSWAAIRDEIRKAPRLSVHLTYTLVLWSLNLSPQLQQTVHGLRSRLFTAGAWLWRKDSLQHVAAADATDSASTFVVHDGMQLLVANPALHGGLEELLGAPALRALRQLARDDGGDLRVEQLAEWAAVELQADSQQNQLVTAPRAGAHHR